MIPFNVDGIICAVRAHELEDRSKAGWVLVGIVEAEEVGIGGESQVVEPNQWNSCSSTQLVTKTHTIKAPLFIMSKEAGAEVARLTEALAEAVKAKATAEDRVKEVSSHLVSLQRANKSHEDTTSATREELRVAKAECAKQQTVVEALNQKIVELEQTVQTARLSNGRPTAFERLLEEIPGESKKSV